MVPQKAPRSLLPDPDTIATLEAVERKALWLSSWLIHNANHIRPSRDGLKVGGHQASCASAVTSEALSHQPTVSSNCPLASVLASALPKRTRTPSTLSPVGSTT